MIRISDDWRLTRESKRMNRLKYLLKEALMILFMGSLFAAFGYWFMVELAESIV